MNATIEHDIKQIATGQARAARAWVEAHLLPRETDLADAIERRDRFDLDREIDLARSRLVTSEGILQATEERRGRLDGGSEADFNLELTARREQLSHRQHIVALLNQRIERLGRMRATWKRRYAVLGDRLELEDLEGLTQLYQSDLATLDAAIQLEDRLRAELSARLENRDLAERIRGLAGNVRSFWSFELTTSADRPITPGKIFIALSVFVAGYVFARFMLPILTRRFFPRLGFDAGASNAFASLTFYAMIGITGLFALRAVNIPLAAFAVVGGALGIGFGFGFGFGFGSQAVVSNFISGLLLLAERPIRIGDLVEIGGVVGTAETIGLRSTRIRTADNFHIIVPNASFLETNVINWTRQDPRMRLRISVGVAYGSPIREVERLLIEAARAHPRSLDDPAPTSYFMDFGDSALLFEVRFWIRYDERMDRSAILSDIRFRIDELLAENGIVIAFPQLDVHFDNSRSSP